MSLKDHATSATQPRQCYAKRPVTAFPLPSVEPLLSDRYKAKPLERHIRPKVGVIIEYYLDTELFGLMSFNTRSNLYP